MTGQLWSAKPTPYADGELLVRRAPGAWEVTFNRPAKHNAFTDGMYAALEQVCEGAAADPVLQVLVVRGAGGRAFAAGNDIASFGGVTNGAEGVAFERRIRQALEAIAQLSPVTIAMVDGLCVGGGLAVAAACDLRIATPNARFGYPIARTLGNVLAAPLLLRCREVFGDSLTREMLLASRLVDAARAHQVGAVIEVVEAENLQETTESLVSGILQAAPLTLRMTKEQLREGDRFDSATDEARLAEAYGSADFREGVRAFLAKEVPQFGSGQRRRT